MYSVSSGEPFVTFFSFSASWSIASCRNSGVALEYWRKDSWRLFSAPSGVGSIFPTAQLPMVSQVFTVTARASVDDITRTVEAVVDVTTKTEPRLLSWRTR